MSIGQIGYRLCFLCSAHYAVLKDNIVSFAAPGTGISVALESTVRTQCGYVLLFGNRYTDCWMVCYVFQ